MGKRRCVRLKGAFNDKQREVQEPHSDPVVLL